MLGRLKAFAGTIDPLSISLGGAIVSDAQSEFAGRATSNAFLIPRILPDASA